MWMCARLTDSVSAEELSQARHSNTKSSVTVSIQSVTNNTLLTDKSVCASRLSSRLLGLLFMCVYNIDDAEERERYAHQQNEIKNYTT